MRKTPKSFDMNASLRSLSLPRSAHTSVRSIAASRLALPPLESGQFIAEKSQDVFIHQDGIDKCAKYVYKEMMETDYGVKSWLENEMHPKTMDKAAIEWVFVVDSLNFSFWTDETAPKLEITYKSHQWTGYWALCAAITKALKEGVPITDAGFYSKITREELAIIFKSDTGAEIPLLDERVEVLHQVGETLLDKYDGQFSNCVAACHESAEQLLNAIVQDFIPFQDEAIYEGRKVSLYKRAQILVADVWGCCAGKGLGRFNDIHYLTMFADYRVPQVLVHFGALSYSDKLKKLLHKDILMENGERMEVEIRGCSIWATELVCKKMQELQEMNDCIKDSNEDIDICPVLVDMFLWDFRRENAIALHKIPFHKVRCIYY